MRVASIDVAAVVALITSVVACDSPARPSQGASDSTGRPGAITSAANAASAVAPFPFMGRVLDYQTGAAITNATVRIYRGSDQPAFSPTSDASGSFSFRAPRGFYSMSVDGFARLGGSGTIR